MKQVVMIIPQNDFRDEELFIPKSIFEQNGFTVKVASTTNGNIKGTLGASIKPDMLVSDIKIADFVAIVFVGGSGSQQYWDDVFAHKLIKDGQQKNLVIAAICIAPVTLANAGILEGKRATVFSSSIKQLKAKGAIYTGASVESDNRIITASGPSAAKEFAEEIIKVLNKR